MFLSAPENLDMLSRPWKPFPEPSAQAKNRFETKTAPAAVTPSPNGHYNLDDIKADSLWLSREAGIAECAALRLVVQEWQARPAVQLLSGFTEEEALSVQDAAGFSNPGASTLVPSSSLLGAPSSDFDSSDQRRLRLVDIYYSACTAILRISQLLVAWSSARQLRQTAPNAYTADYRVGEDWLEQMGQAIVVKQNQKDAKTPSDAPALDKCTRAVKVKLDALDAGFSWDVSDPIYEAAVARWVTAQTTELVHVLHLALLHADLGAKEYLPASAIEEWFTVISEAGFFRDFPTVRRPLRLQRGTTNSCPGDRSPATARSLDPTPHFASLCRCP